MHQSFLQIGALLTFFVPLRLLESARVWPRVLEAARQQDRCSVVHNLTTTRNSVFFLGVTGLGSCPSKCCLCLQGNRCQYVMYSVSDPSRQTGVYYMWAEDHTAWFQDHAGQHSWHSKIPMPDRILTYPQMSVQYPSLVTFKLTVLQAPLLFLFSFFMLQHTFLQVQFSILCCDNAVPMLRKGLDTSIT